MRGGWVVLLVGCGAASAGASVPVAPASVDPCTDAPAGFSIVVPDAIASTWNGSTIVGGTASVTLRHCGEGTITVERMTLGDGGPGGAEWELDPSLARLAHGQALTREIRGTAEPRELTLIAHARDEHGTEVIARATTHAVLDPRFVSERDACVAAGGTFAPAGLSGDFVCDRPTHDAGRRCLSSAECEGPCLDDHVEVTTTPPDQRTCAAGEEVRLHVGACSARSLQFGCGPLLTTVTTECAAPGRASRLHTVCVD